MPDNATRPTFAWVKSDGPDETRAARLPTDGVLDPRTTELLRLLPLWPHEIADRSVDGLTRLVAHLRRALRRERQRGVAGHWTYSVGRHAALSRAYEREVAALRVAGDDVAAGDGGATVAVARELRMAHGHQLSRQGRSHTIERRDVRSPGGRSAGSGRGGG